MYDIVDALLWARVCVGVNHHVTRSGTYMRLHEMHINTNVLHNIMHTTMNTIQQEPL